MVQLTKKQKRLLDYLAIFIDEHGYGPSYREIMSGLNYGSVATVAKHVDNLVAAGFVRKKDNSARSLEVVGRSFDPFKTREAPTEKEEKWLVQEIERQFEVFEQNPSEAPEKIDELYVLVGALKILGLTGAFTVFAQRLKEAQETVKPAEQ